MSKEDQEKATDELLKDLGDFRDMKKLSVQNVPINAFHDTQVTIKKVEDEVMSHQITFTFHTYILQLTALHARTGTITLLMAVRSNTDHYNIPYIVYTSNRVAEFFELSVKHQLPDLAMRLEAYCLSGVQGTFTIFWLLKQSTNIFV
jgi:hypothetical protein